MSARDDAIEAAARALHWPGCNHGTGGPAECDSRAMTAVPAAIPVLLAPLRAVVDRALADVDAGHRNNAIAGLISADVILREIEGKS